MPSIAQSPIEVPSRKRRREDENHSLDLEIQMKLSSPRNGSSFFPSSNESHHPSHNSNTEFPHTQSRRLKPVRFTPHDLKRQRVEHEQLALHIFPHSEELQNFKTIETRKVKAVLDPCHICHRKPTVRSDLDSYADCEGCGERTCYICIRECMGPGSDWREEMAAGFYAGNGDLEREGESKRIGDGYGGKVAKEWGHRGMVCSRCCVERGSEGEVCCLGCLRREEDG